MAQAAHPGVIRVSEVAEFGGPELLLTGERPWPAPGTGEVIVRIGAACVNPADLAARSGAVRRRLPDLRPPFVPGWDLAGVVCAVGDQAGGYAVGDPVVGMIPWIEIGGRAGAYAEAVAVDPSWLAPRPAGLDEISGATVPLNALTARQMLDLIAAPHGATVLVTGASGGVGGFATQLAVRDGLRVLAVASDGDEDWVADLGPDEVLSRSTGLGNVRGVDAVIDAVPLGNDAAATVRGGGVAVFTRRVELAAGRRLRAEMPLARCDPSLLAELTRQVADGSLRTRVARTFDLGNAAEAHRLLENGGLRGKVVLKTT